MARFSRGAMLVASGSVLIMAGAFAACGLDESGIVGGDASINDVSLDNIVIPDIQVDNFIPVPDAAPDTSSCVDAAVPSGWALVGMKMEAGVTCPGQSTDFQFAQYVTNPTLDSNSCQCGGCGTTGTWACGGTLSTGPTCGQSTTANGPGCVAMNGFHYSATVQRSGTVACGGGQATGTGDASATPVGTCIPQTTQADFCGLAQQGFGLCIVNSNVTDGGCPSGFSNPTIVGVQAFAACTTCTCDFTNADAGCGAGTVTAYSTNNCDGGELGSQGADGGCVNTSGFGSLLFAPDPPPTPSCLPSAPSGVPLLAGPLTICCP